MGQLNDKDQTFFFRKRVAVASRHLVTHDMGRSDIPKSHKRRGHMAALYRSSFCCLETGTELTLFSKEFSLLIRWSLILLWCGGI